MHWSSVRPVAVRVQSFLFNLWHPADCSFLGVFNPPHSVSSSSASSGLFGFDTQVQQSAPSSPVHTRFACLPLSPIPKTPEAQDSTQEQTNAWHFTLDFRDKNSSLTPSCCFRVSDAGLPQQKIVRMSVRVATGAASVVRRVDARVLT